MTKAYQATGHADQGARCHNQTGPPMTAASFDGPASSAGSGAPPDAPRRRPVSGAAS